MNVLREAMLSSIAFSWVRTKKVQKGAWIEHSQTTYQDAVRLGYA